MTMSRDGNKTGWGLVPFPSSSSSSSNTWFPSPSSDLSNFSVGDYLVVEILCRLPSIKWVVRCMCVSKGWYRIISSHYFVRRFINHHINSANAKQEEEEDDQDSEGNNNNNVLTVRARCHLPRGDYQSSPSPIVISMVVSIQEGVKEVATIDIYTSETGKWCRFPLADVLQRVRIGSLLSNVVSLNGKLHWYNGEVVVAFDPFNTRRTCFIQVSSDIQNKPAGDRTPFYSLSVCLGSLRCWQLVFKTILAPLLLHHPQWKRKVLYLG
ncbi:hypothetical protein Tsubulata_051123, partial [Turnera subulata]